MKDIIKIAVLTSLLAGCTSTSDIMQTWIGSPESKLVSNWGAPDRSLKTDDGKEILTWNGRNGYGGIICQKTFVISKAGYIESYSNNCPR